MALPPLIILTAAEASGDLHAANLARAIRRRIPNARLVAFGGPRLAEAGVELLADLAGQSAMLLGSLARVPQMIGRLIQFDRYLARHHPELHITVDSPAANLPLAGRSRARGVPVLGYVAPQLWAWAPWRMGKVRRRVNRLACILPFEPAFFTPHGIAAEFVGHPIFEPLVNFHPDAAFVGQLPDGSPKIALLPGSRAGEITRHLPAQLRVAAAIRRTHPHAAFVVAAPPAGHGHSLDIGDMVARINARETASRRPVEPRSPRLDATGGLVTLAEGRLHDTLAWADLVLAVSGSVTLEVAWFARPMVVMYHVPRWQWNLVGRWLIRKAATPYFSLPNIVAANAGAGDGCGTGGLPASGNTGGQSARATQLAGPAHCGPVVPEVMPWFGSDEPLIAAMESLIADPGRQEKMRSDLTDLVKPLAAGNASQRVAEIAAEMIGC